MKLRHLPVRLALATVLAATALTPQLVKGQAVASDQASAVALQLFNDGKYQNAAVAYESILKDYPTSLVIPEANFRLGYIHYLLGDFDKSLEYLNKILSPPAAPELQELGYSVIPQALAGKAAKIEDEGKRKAGLEDAIKNYDVYLQKFPNGQQVESALYGRSLCSLQLAKYDDAAKTLRESLKRFARSESILDTQYLLALVLATQGSQGLQANANDPSAAALCDEAEKFLRDVIAQRKDIALLNDAQFQIGELLFNRGMLGPKAKQADCWKRAMQSYRSVFPKELMVRAQEIRISGFLNRRREALAAKDVAGFKRLERLEDTERSKLEALKAKGDLTVASQVKVAQIFFQEGAYDEARVLLRHAQGFIDDVEQKKSILYYTTLSYASQNLRDQAVAAYDTFQSNHKGDSIADNLPLVIGSLFLANPAEPEKAVSYFDEGTKLYPEGRFVAETMSMHAAAMVQLKRFDEAIKTYQTFLASKPKAELAAQAELGLASVYQELKKAPEAIAAFKKVRDTYPGTAQAEQAAFWAGHLAMQINDFASALKELDTYIKTFPEGDNISTAKFDVAVIQARSDKPKALALFKEIGDKYPDSQAGPYSYLQRATILIGEQKLDEVESVFRDFIARYPTNPNLYQAYDRIAQIKSNAGKPVEALAVYAEMVEKHPDNSNTPLALLKIAQDWNTYTKSQGNYAALNEEQRAEWNKGISNSTAAVEKMLEQYPGVPQVALALKTLLSNQKYLVGAQQKTGAEVTKYFESLATKFGASPELKSKVLFALAAFTFESDKAKALAQMEAAYNPGLVYSPDDLDLYGSQLLENKKIDESIAVYTKLAADYPTPPGVAPAAAPTTIQEAQAISLFGRGKALQIQGKVDEAATMFGELRKHYSWSPKMLEANYGIAAAQVQQGKGEETIPSLLAIIRAPTATADLRAKAMLLLGKVQEAQGDIPGAIDQFIKVSAFYGGVELESAEGLWLGGQLLEKQAATLPEALDAKDLKDPNKKKNPTRPGQLRKAYQAYQDIVDKYSSSGHVEKAKARLKALEQYAPPKK